MNTDEAARIPLLAALKEKDRAKVLANTRTRTFAPGETVVREGDSGLNVFVIVLGHAGVRHPDGSVVATLGPGQFFGELAIVEEHPRTATVVAEDELTVLLFPAWEFRTLLDEHPEIAVPMLHALIRRLHGMTPHEH